MSMNNFVDAFRTPDPFTGLLQAYVVSVQTGYTITVGLDGDQTNTISGVRYAGHVIPKPGTMIWVQRQGSTLIAIANVAGAGATVPFAIRYYDGTTAPPGHTGLTIAATTTSIGYVPIAFQLSYHDPWNMYSATLSPLTSGITYLDAPTVHPGYVAPISGAYMFGGSIGISGLNSGYYTGSVFVTRVGATAGTAAAVTQLTPSGTATQYIPVGPRTMTLAQGDKVHLALRAVSGATGTATLQGGSMYETSLWIQYVGPAA